MNNSFNILSARDVKALLSIVIVIFIIIMAIRYVGEAGSLGDGHAQADSLHNEYSNPRKGLQHGKTYYPKDYIYDEGTQHTELFTFDPNTADSTQLLRLGLKPWQVRSIYRFRAKGGVFHKIEDFAKVYKLTVKQYETLKPYISISEDFKPAYSKYHTSDDVLTTRDTVLFPAKLKEGEYISINTADTTELKKVPGVGSYYARQIIRERDNLGGFYSTKQIADSENLPQSVKNALLKHVKIDETAIKRINGNKASMKQMRFHPYIGFNRAETIMEHIRRFGPINNINELALHNGFSDEERERLSHYLYFK